MSGETAFSSQLYRLKSPVVQTQSFQLITLAWHLETRVAAVLQFAILHVIASERHFNLCLFVSWQVVEKIAKPFVPSAFQIRFAGFKGVLAVDPRLPGKQAFFRPSMRKFESFHRRLEVLQTSRPQAVYLNHQVIMLLSNLGVPDEVFISLQKNMLDKLAGKLSKILNAGKTNLLSVYIHT